MSTYTPTIGLEVHAELKTDTKMFCGCKNSPHDSDPNQNTCPVCLAHPGTLPVPNEKAIESILLFGKSVGGTLAKYSEFDRKNYFYPDIPKAYQISQYEFPFVMGGELAGVQLTRVHLEEDTARSQHDKGNCSLVDFNRAGVPLMELVTEPVITDAQTATKFAQELQLMLRTLGISDANMERGEMRVEANISVSKTDTLGTKVEVKNLNSFKSVSSAIDFEINRHIKALEAGEEIIQETRGWDEAKSKTFTQRVKESAHDYRYFPDPDLPKIDTTTHSNFSDEKLTEKLPILPVVKREIYFTFASEEAVEAILANPKIDNLLLTYHNAGRSKEFLSKATNYLLTDVIPILQSEDEVPAANFAILIEAVGEGKLTSRIAKDLIPKLIKEDIDPVEYAESEGLIQSNDESVILPIVNQVLDENESVVKEVIAGKETALKFLIGQGMKLSRGSANPGVLSKLISVEIEKRK